MKHTNKIPKKHHYDTKLPCPGCGERIGFVESTCPFCGDSIPFWSDKAGKILLGIGCFLVLGYLIYLLFVYDSGYLLLSYLGRAFVALVVALALADRTFRY